MWSIVRDGPPEADVKRYQDELVAFGQRLSTVRDLLGHPPTTDLVERAALHLRFVIEGVVLSSLIANRPELEKVSTALHKHDADAARKLLRRTNPGYWPQPYRRVKIAEAQYELHDVAADYVFLREDEWGRAIGHTSELLHAPNPFAEARSVGADHERMWDILLRLEGLLRSHRLLIARGQAIAGTITFETREAQASGWGPIYQSDDPFVF
jgi:hypothetical protein